MKTTKKPKVLKSFVTKKKKSCLKTNLKSKPKKPRKPDNYDCNFVDELKLRSKDCCLNNPNYAIICDFLIKFTDILDLPLVPLKDLQLMIGANGETHPDLVQMHVLLLRKLRLPKIVISKKTWEKALGVFCSREGDLEMEGIHLETAGYSAISVNTRLEILKCLMEAQFLCNELVKFECDNLPTEELRQEPTGADIAGNIYWTQMSEEGDLRIYSESSEINSWETKAQTRENLVDFLSILKSEKLYVQEQNRLAATKEVEKEKEPEDIIVKLQQEIKQFKASKPEYSCEICSVVGRTKLQLLEHYSSLHLNRQLKEKFPHLVEGTVCKICTFDAKLQDEDEESDLIWIHLGTIHEKINPILKAEGLSEVSEIQDIPRDSLDKPLENKPKPNCDIETMMSCDTDKSVESLDELSDKPDKQGQNCQENNNQATPDDENRDADDETNNADDDTNNADDDTNNAGDDDKAAMIVDEERNDNDKTDRNEVADGEKLKGIDNQTDDASGRRRSTRLNKAGLDPLVTKQISEAVNEEKKKLKKDREDKKRKERKISCKLCGIYDSDSVNPIYSCICGNGWHKACIKPKLYTRPGRSWRCPLCNHASLVAMLQQVLLEFDVLMEKVEVRRLAKLRENRSASSVEVNSTIEEEVLDEEWKPEVENVEKVEVEQVDTQPEARENIKLMINYAENSTSESDADSEDEEWKRIRNTCLCVEEEGTKKCVYCKRLKGCTCDGAGTCRLCMSEDQNISEDEKVESSPEVLNQQGPASVPQMSTTELFLLTGEVRAVPEVPAQLKIFTPTGRPKKKTMGMYSEINLVDDDEIPSTPIRTRGTPRGSPRTTPRGTPRGRATPSPRGTPLSSRASSRGSRGSFASPRVLDNSFRRNIYQEIIDIDQDEEDESQGQGIDPESPAAKYFPNRVVHKQPAQVQRPSFVSQRMQRPPRTPNARYPRLAAPRNPRMLNPGNPRLLSPGNPRMQSPGTVGMPRAGMNRARGVNPLKSQASYSVRRNSAQPQRPVRYPAGHYVRGRQGSYGQPHNQLAIQGQVNQMDEDDDISAYDPDCIEDSTYSSYMDTSDYYSPPAQYSVVRPPPVRFQARDNQPMYRGRAQVQPARGRHVTRPRGRAAATQNQMYNSSPRTDFSQQIRVNKSPGGRTRGKTVRLVNPRGRASLRGLNAFAAATHQAQQFGEIVLDDEEDDISCLTPEQDDISCVTRGPTYSNQEGSTFNNPATSISFASGAANTNNRMFNTNLNLGHNTNISLVMPGLPVGPDPDITDIGVDPSTSPGVDPTLPRVETSFSLVQQPTHDDIAMDPDHPEYVDTADYSNEDFSIHSRDVIFEEASVQRVSQEERSNLARLPPGILVRKVRELQDDYVELE